MALLGVLALAVVFIGLEASYSRAEQRDAIYDLQREVARLTKLLQQREAERGSSGFSDGQDTSVREKLEQGVEAARPTADQAGSPRETRLPPSPAWFLQRLNAAWPLREALKIARELAALPGENALRILQAIYKDIDNAEVRELVLGPLVSRHPQLALKFLHLGATDAVAEVRDKALGKLSRYAFVDFTAHPEQFESWWETYGHRPAGAVLAECATALAVRLGTLEGPALFDALTKLARLPIRLARQLGVDLSKRLREAGVLEPLDRLLQSGDKRVRERAWAIVASIGADEAFLRRNAVPLLRNPGDLPVGVADSIYRSLAAQRQPWATDQLTEAMVRTPARSDASYYSVGQALAESKDPRSIPKMIGMIVADDTYKTIYGIGYFGLGRLTGVPYDKSHDGKWWLQWWEKNQHRLPESVRGQQIPKIQIRR